MFHLLTKIIPCFCIFCWQHRNYTALGKIASSPLVHASSTAQVINFNHWVLIACAKRLDSFSYLELDLPSYWLEILGHFFQWYSGPSTAAGNLAFHILDACPLWAEISAQGWPRHTTHRFGTGTCPCTGGGIPPVVFLRDQQCTHPGLTAH